MTCNISIYYLQNYAKNHNIEIRNQAIGFVFARQTYTLHSPNPQSLRFEILYVKYKDHKCQLYYAILLTLQCQEG